MGTIKEKYCMDVVILKSKKIIESSFTSSGMGDIWEIVTKMIDEIWDGVNDGKNIKN